MDYHNSIIILRIKLVEVEKYLYVYNKENADKNDTRQYLRRKGTRTSCNDSRLLW
jgi:hypothetical protein